MRVGLSQKGRNRRFFSSSLFGRELRLKSLELGGLLLAIDTEGLDEFEAVELERLGVRSSITPLF